MESVIGCISTRGRKKTIFPQVLESRNQQPSSDRDPVFHTTHWSVVLEAAGGDSFVALERLCQTYWYPIYAFVRREGHNEHDAQDLTQGFFELFLAKHYLKQVDRDKGHFRSFLLASLKHYLANEWKKANRQKRGGSVETISFDAADAEDRYRHEPAEESSAELIYGLLLPGGFSPWRARAVPAAAVRGCF